MDQAREGYKKGDGDFVELFVKDYAEANGAGKLGALFAARLKEKNITFNSSDAQVQKALEEEVDAAVANSNEVVRSRIDRFGVAQPNIQILRGKGQIGQIMVEMPGMHYKASTKSELRPTLHSNKSRAASLFSRCSASKTPTRKVAS